MSYIDIIKDKLNSGYILFYETYDDGTKIYSVRTPKVNGSCTVYAEIARNIAYMIKRQTGAEIVTDGKIYKAINFIPVPVKPGCIRTFHS